MIEKLLHAKEQPSTGNSNLHKALILSVNKMKKYHKNEQTLTRKVEQLEHLMRDQKSTS